VSGLDDTEWYPGVRGLRPRASPGGEGEKEGKGAFSF